MKRHTLNAEKRALTGRKVRKLRREGLMPGTLYGKKITSSNVQVKTDEFLAIYKEVGETGLVDLTLEGKAHPVLVTNIQIHSVSDLPLHIDFREVDLTEKVTASVPVELVGESPVEKQGNGTVVLLTDEVEVEALPTDLPEKFEIDATMLVEVDQAVTVADLKYDSKKIEIQTAADQILAKVEPPQKEEVVEAPAPTEGEEAATPVAEGEVAPAAEATEEKSAE
jgi:large subunit ribosomal protein L25